MNLAKYNWLIPAKNEELNQQINSLKEAGLNYSPAFLRLCVQRGLNTVEAINEATNQEPELFHDPFLLYDMDKAIERLQQAVANQENIVIYGDYDADGITSTLILLEALEGVGANVSYYLPNRLIDGYGPNLDRYKQLIADGAELILTCDNGVAGHDAILYAKEQGIDVIVTDHHQIQETLPDAYAIIHPEHPAGNYPFATLSGAGVALKVATALLEDIPAEALELAAIGTVADLVSLTNENRTIVINGLKMMQQTQREGLRQLLITEKVNFQQINVDTIGFIIGPRLNAVGRLGDPTPALEMLRSFDIDEVKQYVAYVNQINQERQEIVADIAIEVENRIQSYTEIPPIIIESDPNWPAGVLGIVASRLTDKYQRPAIIFQENKEEQFYRGSGRSIESINLFDCLNQLNELLLHFGGHSQAAGVTVAMENWENFRIQLNQIAEQYLDLINRPAELKIDLDLEIEEITNELIEEIDLLGPFGNDNPKPIVSVQNAEVTQLRMIGSQQQHVKLIIANQSNKNETLNAIGFNMVEQFDGIKNADILSYIGQLDINEWRNKRDPQMIIKDIGIRGSQWVDLRGSKIPDGFFKQTETIYLFQNKHRLETFQKAISEKSTTLQYSKIDIEQTLNKVATNGFKHLAIVEPPQDLDKLIQLIQSYDWEIIYLGSYMSESKYLVGFPNRQEIAQIYRWVKEKDEFVVNDGIQAIHKQAGMSLSKIKLIFLMFFQAGFVTIKDGLLKFDLKTKQEKVDLNTLPVAKQYLQSMKVEEFLNFQPINQIKETIERDEFEWI